VSREPRILVFVHDATDAEMIEMQVRKGRVRCAFQRVVTKDQFLKALRSDSADLVIADATFPRVDLAEIMKKTLATSPEVPWVILAGAQPEDAVVGWMKAGAGDVVTRKNLARLGGAVSELLAKSAETAPAAGAKDRADFPDAQTPGPASPASAPAAPATPAPAQGSAARGPSGQQAVQPPAAAGRSTVPQAGAPPAAAAPEADLVFRDLFDHAEDLVTLMDEEGIRLYSNPAHREVLDTPERLRGTTAFVDVHPDDRQRVAEIFHESFQEGKSARLEYRLMDNKGSLRSLESVGSPFRSSASGQMQAVVISRDITERVQREQDYEALLKALGPLSGEPFFQNLVNVIAQTLAARYVLISECLYQPCERVRSLAYLANGAFMPPFEYDLADTTCEAVFATGAPVHYPDSVQELFPKETALVAMAARSYLGVPLIGTGSVIVGHIFLMDDKRLADPSRTLHMLTQVAGRAAMEVERFRRDRSGRAAEFRLRFILESLADGVLVIDSQGIVTYLNEQVVSLVGHSGVDIIGKPLSQFLETEKTEEDKPLPDEGDIQVRFRCSDNTFRAATLQAKPLTDAARRVIGTVFLVRPAAD